jgi:hypothetical protein
MCSTRVVRAHGDSRPAGADEPISCSTSLTWDYGTCDQRIKSPLMAVPPGTLLCRSVPEFTASWRRQTRASVGHCQAVLTHARTVDHAWITLPVARAHQQHAVTWCWDLRLAPRVSNASDGRSFIDHTGRWPDAHPVAALDASTPRRLDASMRRATRTLASPAHSSRRDEYTSAIEISGCWPSVGIAELAKISARSPTILRHHWMHQPSRIFQE